ncbi:CBL-interacting protein kinase family protein [Echinococcus multilocularis]|uniref:CBL-interacting protein kinase family protein n=1 Tax=Echinococcus multilocularis TaxID=6211 RepID=A0A0S4MN02_ECHMU|nr:CBL-interacting protein kinase family protein [Echinococcus multilocularis]
MREDWIRVRLCGWYSHRICRYSRRLMMPSQSSDTPLKHSRWIAMGLRRVRMRPLTARVRARAPAPIDSRQCARTSNLASVDWKGVTLRKRV